MKHEESSVGNLEELREQISEYYLTYYAELRSRLQDLDPITLQLVPETFKGYRRIVVMLGEDGIVVTHWPDGQDSFDFHISPERTAAQLAAEQCAGERILDYPPGSDFGTHEIDEPLQLVADGRVVWVAPWTRMEISSRFDIWQSTEQARRAARENLSPYTKDRPASR